MIWLMSILAGLWILLICAILIWFVYFRNRVPVPKVWHLHIQTPKVAHKIMVPDDVYEAFKVWVRGEGDSLFEITADDAYLGLRRDHVVSVKAVRK